MRIAADYGPLLRLAGRIRNILFFEKIAFCAAFPLSG